MYRLKYKHPTTNTDSFHPKAGEKIEGTFAVILNINKYKNNK